MLVRIANSPRPYAWGSRTAIADLLGTVPSGGPEAELWFGSHPGSPARVVDDGRGLDEWLAASGEPLPFLLKILAASGPLSLQVHPNAEQAAEGFERENAAGIPLDAPHRNYKDSFAKPEIVVALGDRFEALCGFRPVEQTRDLLADLGLTGLAGRLDDLPGTVEWLVTRGDGVDDLIAEVTALAASGNGIALETARTLAEAYPGDPGIVVSLLLNRVTLRRGEALYMPAGNIHAYLSGIGMELMASSDNIVRCGLTPKHVDVPELLALTDFTELAEPRLEASEVSTSVTAYRPDGPGFELLHVTGDTAIDGGRPMVVVCTAGGFEVAHGGEALRIERGESLYVAPDAGPLTVAGAGELFVATTR